MKVILLQDVAKIGRRHSVVEVPDGYARNKLIPMRAALPATPEQLAKLKAQVAQAAAHEAADTATLTASLDELTKTPLVITVTANEHGHLFKQVTTKDVAATAASVGHPVPVTAITIAEPIKAVGEHTVWVRVATEVVPLVIMVKAA